MKEKLGTSQAGSVLSEPENISMEILARSTRASERYGKKSAKSGIMAYLGCCNSWYGLFYRFNTFLTPIFNIDPKFSLSVTSSAWGLF